MKYVYAIALKGMSSLPARYEVVADSPEKAMAKARKAAEREYGKGEFTRVAELIERGRAV